MALFEQLRNPVMRYLISLGLPVQEAEDVTQEVFMALFLHLKQGKSRRSLRGWIFRVARNMAFKQMAAKGRSGEIGGLDGASGETQADSAPSAEEQVLTAGRLRRLVAVFRALPEQDQSCLRLRAEGLRYREIAGVLEMSLGAVSESITRSLARLMRAEGR